jgi:shikimate dehydrogenase
VEISASTRLLAVIGDPVAHSLSPLMHNAAIRALGLDAVYVPHKEAAERCVARKTDLCIRVGACNTFWTEDGELVGDNTDVAAILACLTQLGADGEDWLLMGTGGAARAAAMAAADASARLHVLSRDAARARAFAEWAQSRGVRAEPDGSAPCARPAWPRRTAARCWCARGRRRSAASSPVMRRRSTSCAPW